MTTSAPAVPATALGRWPRWAGWLLLAAGLAGIVVVAVAGRALAARNPVGGPELRLNQWLADHRTPGLDLITRVIHLAIGPIIGPCLAVLACLLIWWRGQRRFAASFAVVTLVTWLATGLTKLVVDRQRPPGGLLRALFVADGHDSYPSGHTAFAAAIVAGLAAGCALTGRRVWPVLLAGVGFIAVVAAARMYAGVHYLADVLAGAADVGFAALALAGTALLVDRRWPQLGILPTRPALTERPTTALSSGQ